MSCQNDPTCETQEKPHIECCLSDNRLTWHVIALGKNQSHLESQAVAVGVLQAVAGIAAAAAVAERDQKSPAVVMAAAEVDLGTELRLRSPGSHLSELKNIDLQRRIHDNLVQCKNLHHTK